MEADVRAIIAVYGNLEFEIDLVRDDTDLYRCGLTSHASVNLMLALEDAYEIVFPPNMLNKSVFASVNAIQAAIAELTASDASIAPTGRVDPESVTTNRSNG